MKLDRHRNFYQSLLRSLQNLLLLLVAWRGRPRCLYPEGDGGGGSGGGSSVVSPKEESEESLKPDKVVPTGLAQIVGLDGKGCGKGAWGMGGCPAGGTEVI